MTIPALSVRVPRQARSPESEEQDEDGTIEPTTPAAMAASHEDDLRAVLGCAFLVGWPGMELAEC